MKTVTKEFNLYEIDELSRDAREKAIMDYINFEVEVMDEESPYYGYVEEWERMQTPWFLHQVIYDKEKESIIDTIKANEYLFFENGELIPLDYYPA